MGYNNITNKLEQAARDYLRGVGLELVDAANIHMGLSADELSTPYVACVCQSADVEEIYDGNWSADLELQVVSSAEDYTSDQHRALAAEIFSWWFIDKTELETNLSAALENFTAQFVMPRRQTYELVSSEKGDRRWESKLLLTVKCCGSDIT